MAGATHCVSGESWVWTQGSHSRSEFLPGGPLPSPVPSCSSAPNPCLPPSSSNPRDAQLRTAAFCHQNHIFTRAGSPVAPSSCPRLAGRRLRITPPEPCSSCCSLGGRAELRVCRGAASLRQQELLRGGRGLLEGRCWAVKNSHSFSPGGSEHGDGVRTPPLLPQGLTR